MANRAEDLASHDAERASELAAATSGGGRKKTVKRTKTGLVPWWVRKRLQEQAEPDQKASSDVQQQPEKAKRKKMPNVVEVSIVCSCPHSFHGHH